MQFKDLRKNRLSAGEQFCFWLLLVGPLALLFSRLARWLGSAGDEIRLLIFISWLLAALFTALTLQLSGETTGGRKEKSPVSKLWLAGLLPAILLAAIAFMEWQAWGQDGSGKALLIVATALALGNGLCWFFVNFGVQELGRQEAPKSFERHPALHVNPGGGRAARYTAPPYFLLATLLMAGFFLFSFLLRSSTKTPPAIALLLIFFVFTLFALLGLNRHQVLLQRAKTEHVGQAGINSFNNLAWFLLGTIIAGFFAGLGPLGRMVKWGERLRWLNPPRAQAEALLPQNQSSLAGGGSQGGWLLVLLLLLLLALLAFFLGRKLYLRRGWAGIRKRLIAFLVKLWAVLRRWFSRIRKRPQTPSPATIAALASLEPVDVFDNPELLSKLTATQIVLATYHLLLYLAARQGWLAHARPPLENLSLLSAKGRLEAESLGLLTWLYLRAAYSSRPLPQEDLPRIKSAWEKLKPALLGPPPAEGKIG